MVRWGVLGCGGIANKFLDALSLVDGAEAVACGSRDRGRAESLREKFRLPRAYDSYEELADNPEIDAVYVANTHNFHYETAKLCLEHGKHVLVEKAFTINAAQADELRRLAQKRGLFLMEAMWTRFLPAVAWAREVVKSGEYGALLHVKADYCFRMQFPPSSRIFNPRLAGGGLLDLGIYPLSFVCMLLGTKPARMLSMGSVGKTGVDEKANVLLEYEGAGTADISFSTVYGPVNGALIVMEKGTIAIPNFVDAQKAELTGADGRTILFEKPHENGFLYEVQEACRLIASGKTESEVMPLAQTVEILKLCDRLRAEWGVVYPEEQEKMQNGKDRDL